MAFLDDLLALGLDVSGIKSAQSALENIGTQAKQRAGEVAALGLEQTKFKPFAVTTGVGGVQTTPEGGFSLNLTPEQQALQQTLFGGSQALAGQATAAYDPIYQQLAQQAYGGVSPLLTQAQQASMAAGAMDRGAREQEIMGKFAALQAPQQERDRLALENRLAAQGRLGTQTAQFGGTPEGLALAKAQAEAGNQAALMAMQQAGTEQQQAIARAQGLQGLASGMFGMGTTAQMTPRQIQAADLQNLGAMMTAGYAPERELLTALQPAINIASIADIGRRTGAGLFGEAEMSGIQAQLEAQQRSAELERSLFSSLAQAAAARNQSGAGLFGQLAGATGLDQFKGQKWYDWLFGG